MSTTFTKDDRKFLRAVGIDPEPTPESGTTPLDGTEQMLVELGLPVTRENYLRLAFAGNPPQEPLDGEIEAELPKELQNWECPSGGQSDEPSYTTPQGIPICSTCGHSTRNRNALVCAPCRNGTRLVLTNEDKKLLREIGIAR